MYVCVCYDLDFFLILYFCHFTVQQNIFFFLAESVSFDILNETATNCTTNFRLILKKY